MPVLSYCNLFAIRNAVQKQKTHEYLRTTGLRMTILKSEIVDLFLEGSCGVSVNEVLANLRSKPNISSVYRCLEALEEKGFLRRGISPEGVVQYRCTSQFCPDHGHFSCTECGRILPVNKTLPDRFLKLIEQEYGVKIDYSDFLLEGKCINCRS